jgi:hypothetical protein
MLLARNCILRSTCGYGLRGSWDPFNFKSFVTLVSFAVKALRNAT